VTALLPWLKTVGLFSATALAEIGGCFAAYAWLRKSASPWWLVPGAAALALFAWLLTLHPTGAAGRIYAAYGGVYVASSVLWLWLAEQQAPDRWDLLGAAVCLSGTAIIMFGPRS